MKNYEHFMPKLKFSKRISYLLLFLCLFSLVFAYFFRTQAAGSTKTITVTFKTPPTYATVTKTPLKYNKDFAFSFGFDDGLPEGYENGFKYMGGGTSALLSQTFDGLYFTDGSGRGIASSSVPFRNDFIWYSLNGDGNDFHTAGNSFTWADLAYAYSQGAGVLNHSLTHTANEIPTSTIINYPSPHNPSPIDYNYEVTQGAAYDLSQGGVTVKHMALPSGDQNYIDPAFNNGMLSVQSETTTFNYSGGTVTVPSDGTDVTPTVNLNHYFMFRNFYQDDFFATTSIYAAVDALAQKSRGTEKYWEIGFTHRVGPSTGGSLVWSNYTTLMNHINNTYGRFGDDSIWMAPYQEVYEYLAVKQSAVVSKSLSGNVLTITVDTSAIPTGLRQYALSLLVNSDAEIASVAYGTGDFVNHSENLDTGLINLEWGATFPINDFTRVGAMVSAAESSRAQTDIGNATTYTNLLPSSPDKNNLINRLNNISPLGERWLISLGGDSNGSSNINGLEWNLFNASGSTTAESTSSALVDINNSSTPPIIIAMPMATSSDGRFFKYSGATASPDGSGAYPNAMMQQGVSIYSNTGPAGLLELRGLNPAKKYTVTIFGSSLDSSGRTAAYYNVQGAVKGPIENYNNTTSAVSFTSVSPSATGTVQITTYPQIAHWGRASINILDIREQTNGKPVIVLNGPSFRGITSGLADFSYTLSDDDSDTVALSNYEYSATGNFTGEQATATPALSDSQYSGSSGLTSSSSGVAHRFVWNAKNDLNGQEGTFYLRLKPQGLLQTGAYAQSPGLAIDFKAPVLTNILATSTGAATAQITWTSQEDASDAVNLGLDASYGTNTGELHTGASSIKNHIFSLGGLNTCSLYHYQVMSKDLVGNQTLSGDNNLFTANCLGNAAYTASSTVSANLAATTTVALGSLTVNLAPNSFSGNKPFLQILKIDDAAVLAATSTPSGYRAASSSAFNVNTFSDLNTAQHLMAATSTLVYTYSTSSIAGLDPSTLKIYYYTGSVWQVQPNCRVNTVAQTVTCETNHFSTFDLFGTDEIPTISNSHVTVSGATGVGGVFKAGDTITASWNNGVSGDNNSDITSVIFDLSQFGGSASTTATNSANTWTAAYTIPAGSVNNVSGKQISLTATNSYSHSTALTYATIYSLDNQIPVISASSYSNLTNTTATLSASTTDLATCRYSASNVAYSSMSPMTTTGSTTHSQSLTGLSASTVYSYYILCHDAVDNESALTAISFTTSQNSVQNLVQTVASSTPIVPTSGGSTLTIVTPSVLAGQSNFLDFTINNLAPSTSQPQINLSFNADPKSVRGYAVSLSSDFSRAAILPYQSTDQLTLPDKAGIYTIYVRYYSTTGLPSALLSHQISYIPTSVLTTSPSQSASIIKFPSFSRDLKPGNQGADVKELQQVLNHLGYRLAASGAGSPGHETSTYALSTQKALIHFQNDHAAQILKPQGLKQGNGLFGMATRKLINSLLK